MKIVNNFATFSLQKITGLDAGLDGNLDRGQCRFQPIKFVNLVVPSPYETEPYKIVSYSLH